MLAYFVSLRCVLELIAMRRSDDHRCLATMSCASQIFHFLCTILHHLWFLLCLTVLVYYREATYHLLTYKHTTLFCY